MTAAPTKLKRMVELRHVRRNYSEHWEVYDVSRSRRGRLVGRVGRRYGRSERPDWIAEDRDGRTLAGDTRQFALFGIDGDGGGPLFSSRKKALDAIWEASR